MAIDHTASTAYAGIRYAPRPGQHTRTCAQGSAAQQKFIADLTRDIHATRVAQVRAAHSAHGTDPAARWTEDTVRELLAAMGTAEEAIARQMAAPLVYSSPDAPGTIDTLKTTLQRERAQLRAQTPSVSVAAPAALQADQTYRAADGRVIRVVMSGSGRLYGKVWTPDTQSFEYLPGLLRVPGMVLMTLQEVSEFGQQTGQCCVCCTPLTDTVSIALGIGPICESKYTGKARSRSAKYRAEVLAEYAARISGTDAPAEVPVAPATDAPF